MLFAGLLDHWGQLGPAEIPPKGLHAFRACLRYARLHGIPLRAPRFHPFKPLVALRATLALEDEAERGRAALALFDLGWGRGGDLGSNAEIAGALAQAGFDGAALVERAQAEASKQALRDATAAAVARGVFGIPTCLVGDELFWGLDQLPYLELHLRGEDPIAHAALGELAPEGSSARRPASLNRPSGRGR